MKTSYKQTLLLTLFIALLTLGILDAQYEIVRFFVKIICTSCMGLE